MEPFATIAATSSLAARRWTTLCLIHDACFDGAAPSSLHRASAELMTHAPAGISLHALPLRFVVELCTFSLHHSSASASSFN